MKIEAGKELDICLLRGFLSYNAETGDITWINRPNKESPIRIGQIAGGITTGKKKPYRLIHIFGVKILNHRIAWAIYYGSWPKGYLDHINGDGLDNRISNLREVTKSQNAMNRTVKSDNVTGVKGVSKRIMRTGSVKYVANIFLNGKSKYLGRFLTLAEASEAYELAAKKCFGDYRFNPTTVAHATGETAL